MFPQHRIRGPLDIPAEVLDRPCSMCGGTRQVGRAKKCSVCDGQKILRYPKRKPGMRPLLRDKTCPACEGTGREGWAFACNCVEREVCRRVVARYRWATTNWWTDAVRCSIRRSRFGYHRPHQEFIADVWRTAKRYLSPFEWELFRFHYLEHRSFTETMRRFRMDRAECFMVIRRIEIQLGRVWLGLKPYGLYPSYT